MTRQQRSRSQLLDLREDIAAICADTAYDLYRLGEATDELLMSATQIAELADETAEDFRQAAQGNARTACQWCDGEFYVSRTQPGPHTCSFCRHCDGY